MEVSGKKCIFAPIHVQKSVVILPNYVQKSVSIPNDYVRKSVIQPAFYLRKNVTTTMERTVYQQLKTWKSCSQRKPLILNGARQVGKTWILHDFAQKEYKKEAYVICRKNDYAKALFSKDFDTDRILRGLRAITSVDITPDDTLIILDEVQELPEAIESLKYFCEQAPNYHIIVAGSLLGISLHQGVSFPVGKVDEIDMYPMNFEEFLMAKGEKGALQALKQKDYDTTNIIHEKLTDLLRQYYYVGGMPEAVLQYINTGGLQAVRHIQNRILRGYEADFSKHAPYLLIRFLHL